ncbi:hypothetical protein ACOMHN_031469 [Nucella lapillus]
MKGEVGTLGVFVAFLAVLVLLPGTGQQSLTAARTAPHRAGSTDSGMDSGMDSGTAPDADTGTNHSVSALLGTPSAVNTTGSASNQSALTPNWQTGPASSAPGQAVGNDSRQSDNSTSRGATTGSAPQGARGSTTGSAPQGARGATTGSAPQGARGATTGSAPQGARGATTGSAPQGARGSTTGSAPQGARGSTTGSAPQGARGSNGPSLIPHPPLNLTVFPPVSEEAPPPAPVPVPIIPLNISVIPVRSDSAVTAHIEPAPFDRVGAVFADFASQAVALHTELCGTSCAFTHSGTRQSRARGCSLCFCDQLCHLYGDCCPDVQLLYASAQAINVSLQSWNTMREQARAQDVYTCEISHLKPGDNEGDYDNYFSMVNYCPHNFASDASSPSPQSLATSPVSCGPDCQARQWVEDQCLNTRQSRHWRHVRPVTSAGGVVYRNRFCGKCHGHPALHLSPWTATLTCHAHHLRQVTSATEAYFLALNTSGCDVRFTSGQHDALRRCTSLRPPVIAACNHTGQWRHYDHRVARACGSFTAPVKRMYRNAFCYLCNHHLPFHVARHELAQSFDAANIARLSFFALLDLNDHEDAGQATGDYRVDNGTSRDGDGCGEGMVRDPLQCHCRPVKCSEGLRIKGGNCSEVFSRTNLFGFEVCVRFHVQTMQPVADTPSLSLVPAYMGTVGRGLCCPCVVPVLSLCCPCVVPVLPLCCPCVVPVLSLCCPCVVPVLSMCCPCVVPVLSLCCLYIRPCVVHVLSCVVPVLSLCCPCVVPTDVPVLSLCFPVLSLCCPCIVPVFSLYCPCVVPVLSLQTSMCCPCVVHVLSLCCPCVVPTDVHVLSLCYPCVVPVLSLCCPCVVHVFSLQTSMCFPCVVPADGPFQSDGGKCGGLSPPALSRRHQGHRGRARLKVFSLDGVPLRRVADLLQQALAEFRVWFAADSALNLTVQAPAAQCATRADWTASIPDACPTRNDTLALGVRTAGGVRQAGWDYSAISYAPLYNTTFCPHVVLTAAEFRNFTDHMALLRLPEADVTHDVIPADQGEQRHAVCARDYAALDTARRACGGQEPLPGHADPDRGFRDTWTTMGVLSTVSTCVSLLCLLLVIVTYVALAPLRAGSGQSTLAMTCVLLLAQAVHEAGLEQFEHRALCLVLALLIHALWLTAVFMMTSCTLQLFLAIRWPLRARTALASRSVTGLSLLGAVGLAGGVVGTTVLANELLHGDAGYPAPDGRLCFIRRRLWRRLAFGLPLGLAVLLNVLLFLLALLHLRKAPDIRCSRHDRVSLLACVRLSVVTGACWLSLFLLEIPGTRPWLEYAFVVLLGLQGFLLASTLLLNRRVLHLCRDRWGRRRKGTHAARRHVTASRSSSEDARRDIPAKSAVTSLTPSLELSSIPNSPIVGKKEQY